jgi:hypothetical protein
VPEDMDFTAGITLRSGAVLTADVTRLDDRGITYRTEHGSDFAPWGEVKAVMLASTGHMFAVSDLLRQQEQREPYDAEAMRARAIGLLREAAPRMCPHGVACPLAHGPSG